MVAPVTILISAIHYLLGLQVKGGIVNKLISLVLMTWQTQRVLILPYKIPGLMLS